jgi:hypothetical protein
VSRVLFALLLLLSLTTAAALADDDNGDNPDTGGDAPAGPSPTLTATRPEAPICQVAGSARYLEIRGTGFDAWIDQRLPGTLTDADGNQEDSWRTIWVDPNGNVALAVNLCDDTARQRGPLAPGTHWLFIGDGSGGDPIAATSFDLSDQPVPARTVPLPTPQAPGSAPVVAVPPINPGSNSFTPGPVPTYVPPSGTQAQAGTTPVTGPGSRQQPLPIGSTINTFDNWQVTVTGVTPDAWSGIHNAVPSNVGPAPNLQYFEARVQAIFTGSGSALFSDLRLGLAGASQNYDQVNNSCGLIPDELPPTLVANGGVVRGSVCFAVRTSDAGSLALYDTLAPEAGRTYVALH